VAERTASHFARFVVGLAAHNDGVNGFEEIGHRIVFGHEQEVYGTVRASNVAIKTDAEAQNNFAHAAHF